MAEKPLFFDVLEDVTTKKLKLKKHGKLGDEKTYLQFMINRGLSMNVQTVMWANEVNAMQHITNEMHYDYLMNAIPRTGKMYNKWPKNNIADELEYICELWEVSTKKAKEIYKLLTPEQLKAVKESVYKGGFQKP